MALKAGDVTLDVLPDATNFAKELKRQLEPVFKKLGIDFGKTLGDGLSDSAPKTGEQTGSRFSDAFKATVEKALRSLPDASIKLDDAAAQAKLDDLRARLAKLSAAKVGVDIDAGKALAEVKVIKGELDKLGASSPKIDVKVDIGKATAQLSAIQAEADKVSGRNNGGGLSGITSKLSEMPAGFSGMVTAGVALGPALIPVLSVLAAGVVSVLGPLGAAGAGFGLFGGIAAKAVKDAQSNVQALKDAQDQLAAAKTPEEAAKALLAVDAAQQKVTPGQTAFVGVLSDVKDAWGRLATKFADPALSIAGTVLAPLPGLISRLTPLVDALIPVFGQFAAKINEALSGPGSQKFIDFLIKNAPEALGNLFSIGGSLGTIFGNVLSALTPLGQGILKDIADHLKNIAANSADLGSNKGFQDFLAYVKDNAPKIGQDVKDIAGAIDNIYRAMKPFSGLSLVAIDIFAKFVAKMDPKLLQAIAAGITAWWVATKLLAFYQTLADIAMDENPIGLIIIAVSILVAAIYELVTHWKEVVDFLQGPWGTAISAAIAVFMPFIGLPMLVIGHWRQIEDFFSELWSGLKTGVSDAKDWVVGKFDDLVGWFSGLGGKITGAVSGAFDGVVDAAKSAFAPVAHLWNDTLGRIHFDIPGWVPGVGGKGFSFPTIPGYAMGGPVVGPGSGTSDSIPAMLSHGEFVINAAATRDNFALLSAINSGRHVQHRSGGNTFNTTINQVDDPMGTAVAVARRQAALVA